MKTESGDSDPAGVSEDGSGTKAISNIRTPLTNVIVFLVKELCAGGVEFISRIACSDETT